MHTRRKGAALICVLAVIILLALISTPFVLSMLAYQRESGIFLAEENARYASTGARNFAITQLFATFTPFEKRPVNYLPSYHTPYWDTPEEFFINLKNPVLKDMQILNAQGIKWGINVQDEQGKINLLSAPSNVIRNIFSQIDPRVNDARNYVTIYSIRPSPWQFPQRIRGIYENRALFVDNPFYLGSPGTRVKITKPGLEPVYTSVGGLSLTPPGLIFSQPIPPQYVDGVIEMEARHPVNIHTAPYEVLIALFEGIQAPSFLRFVARINRSDAIIIANAILRNKPKSHVEFIEVIKNTSLSKVKKFLVLLNAINPCHAFIENGTLPITFSSSDVFTIESFGQLNYPSGAMLSSKEFREVVDVAPHGDIYWSLETQYDFDSFFRQNRFIPRELGVMSNIIAQPFPYGNKIISSPSTPPMLISDMHPKPNQSYIQIQPSEDRRGISVKFEEHFPDEIDGKRIQGLLTYPASTVFAYDEGSADIKAGGIEFWLRPDNLKSESILFDVRESDYSNRLTLRYRDGFLELIAKDATLENKLAVAKIPFLPAPQTWHHIGAYYKSTYMGHLLTLIDGFSHQQFEFAHLDEQNNKINTRLAKELSETDTELSLEDGYILSFAKGTQPVILEIGNEIMEYYEKEEIIKPDDSIETKYKVLKRGTRGTTATSHPAGSPVQLLGYSNKVGGTHTIIETLQFPGFNHIHEVELETNRIPKGGSKLADKFGKNTSGAFVGCLTQGKEFSFTISTDATTILFVGTPEDLPPKGFIATHKLSPPGGPKEENEIIFYPKIKKIKVSIPKIGTVELPAFVDIERGMFETQASTHSAGTPFILYGFAVDKIGDYETPYTAIQIDDEWFAPVRFTQYDNINYAIGGFCKKGEPLLRRASCGSRLSSHEEDTDIFPVFVVREFVTDFADDVTLININHRREKHRVRRACHDKQHWNMNQLVAFYDNVKDEYKADGVHTRLLKFPSGELISFSWIKNNPDVNFVKDISGYIDEIRFISKQKNIHHRSSTAVSQDQPTIPENFLLFPPGQPIGALLIGEEIVAYAFDGTKRIYKRGYLGSPRQTHNAGDRFFNLAFLPISALSGGITQDDSRLPLLNPIPFIRMRESYALVNNEVMLIRGLSMLPDFTGKGLYRGMFGTEKTSHEKYSFVYQIPFRYWDTFKEKQFDNTMCYYQASTRLPKAFLKSITIDIENDDPALQTVILVRTNPRAEWWDTNGVRIFRTHTSSRFTINEYLEEGQVDIRIYFQYMPGSFYPFHTWKKTPKIRQIELNYLKNLRILYHQEK